MNVGCTLEMKINTNLFCISLGLHYLWLSILNYKNIREATLELSPKMNCFIGQNGVGKTNVLDAVYYLSFCRSATNPIDSAVIRC